MLSGFIVHSSFEVFGSGIGQDRFSDEFGEFWLEYSVRCLWVETSVRMDDDFWYEVLMLLV